MNQHSRGSVTRLPGCHACQKTIITAQYVIDLDRVMCSSCIDSHGLHREIWPACNQLWHNPLDHLTGIRFSRQAAQPVKNYNVFDR